jgi:hypothetical protein
MAKEVVEQAVTSGDRARLFLAARVAEDEQIVFDVIGMNQRADLVRGLPIPRWVVDGSSVRDERTDRRRDGILRVNHSWARELAHITRHDPARVLGEIAAKRAVIAQREEITAQMREASADPRRQGNLAILMNVALALDTTIKHLCSAYRWDPEYDERWDA